MQGSNVFFLVKCDHGVRSEKASGCYCWNPSTSHGWQSDGALTACQLGHLWSVGCRKFSARGKHMPEVG